MAGSQPHDARLGEQLAVTKSERRTVRGEQTTHDPVTPNGPLGSSPSLSLTQAARKRVGPRRGEEAARTPGGARPGSRPAMGQRRPARPVIPRTREASTRKTGPRPRGRPQGGAALGISRENWPGRRPWKCS